VATHKTSTTIIIIIYIFLSRHGIWDVTSEAVNLTADTTISENYLLTYTKLNLTKLKPGSRDFYAIQPGNGPCLLYKCQGPYWARR